jgi:hypothetical protein
MKGDIEGNLSKVFKIARTEQMNVLRETSRMQMETAGITEWEW